MTERGIRIKRHGITLVEVLLAVGILGIIFMTGAALYVQSGETTVLVKDRSDVLFEAQEAIERMVDEVRNCDALTSKALESFTLTNKGVSTTYSFDGESGSIMRNDVAYAVGIGDFDVEYFDIDDNSAATADQVVRVEISIVASIEGTNKEINSSVIIRRKTAI